MCMVIVSHYGPRPTGASPCLYIAQGIFLFLHLLWVIVFIVHEICVHAVRYRSVYVLGTFRGGILLLL